MTSCIIDMPFAMLRSSILSDSFSNKGNGSYTSLSEVTCALCLSHSTTFYARLGSEFLKAGKFVNQMDQSSTLSRFSFLFSNHPTYRYPTRRHPCIGWRRTSQKFDFPHPGNPFFRGSPRGFRMKTRAFLDG